MSLNEIERSGASAGTVETSDMGLALLAGLHRRDTSGLPKYKRLARALTEGIRLGYWQPGERLPAEEALAEITPYSLGTVQKALRELSDQGLVIKQHGHGSFVSKQTRELQDPWHCRFLDDDGETVLPIYTQALARMEIMLKDHFRLYFSDTTRLMQLDRIIDVNREFKVFSRFFADRSLLDRLWTMPLDELHGTNFRQLIVNECRLPITSITRLIAAERFDDETCRLIECERDTVGMRMQAVAMSGADYCIYFQEFFIPPANRQLQILENS